MPFEPGHPRYAGRKPGQKNKHTLLLKEAIIAAAQKAGGGDMVAYLTKMALEQPGPFLALLGRVLPLQLQGDANNPLVITEVTHRIIDMRPPPQLPPPNGPDPKEPDDHVTQSH